MKNTDYTSMKDKQYCYSPLGMCSKHVLSTSRRLAAERGFGDDSGKKKDKTSNLMLALLFLTFFFQTRVNILKLLFVYCLYFKSVYL